jgi:hypothetical protein
VLAEEAWANGGQRPDYLKNKMSVLFSGIERAIWCEESRAVYARQMYRILIYSIEGTG